MEMLTLILSLSVIMWYIIDRFHPIWESWKHGKYVTIVISGLFAFTLSLGFKLDIVAALGLVDEVSVLGHILTALALMSGSSAVSEIISSVKSKE